MKKSVKCFITISVLIVMLFTSCDRGKNVDQSTLHISPALCEAMLNGATPIEFCDSKGKGTFLESKYLQAQVDNDGCLIITLKNKVISEWKNSFMDLQVLQCVLGDTRDIGITIDYSKDFMDYMKDAHTCGYEISEDFTKVVESPEDNGWYFPIIVPACAKMQVFEGKLCSEIGVEFCEVSASGEIIEKLVYPYNVENDANLID